MNQLTSNVPEFVTNTLRSLANNDDVKHFYSEVFFIAVHNRLQIHDPDVEYGCEKGFVV